MASHSYQEWGDIYASQLSTLPTEQQRLKKFSQICDEINGMTVDQSPISESQKSLIYKEIKRALFEKGFTLPGVGLEYLKDNSNFNKSYGSTSVDNSELLDLISMMRTKGK